MKLLLIASLLAYSAPTVHAFSGGAGGCLPGGPAVGASHLSNGPGQVDFDANLLVNGDMVDPNANLQITTGGVYTMIVESTGEDFLGFLFRVEQGGGTQFVLQAPDSVGDPQMANACLGTDAEGITHSDSSPKSMFTVVFDTLATDPVSVDITLVYENANGVSRYAYMGYTLDVAADTETMGPTDGSGTTAPTAAPTIAATTTTDTMTPTVAVTTTTGTMTPTVVVTNTTATPGPTAMDGTVIGPGGGDDSPSMIPTSMEMLSIMPSETPSDMPSVMISVMPSDVPTTVPATMAPTPSDSGVAGTCGVVTSGLLAMIAVAW